MGVILLLSLIAVPIVEIAVFIEVGGRIGIAATVATVILTAIAGSILLRHQGLATLARARANLEAGQLPMAEVFDGMCLLFAGALLLTPGFVTDTVGLLLFVPAARRLLQRWIGRYLTASGRVRTTVYGRADRPQDPPRRHPQGPGPVIDGDYRDVTPGDGPPLTDERPQDRRDGNG